MRIQTLFKTVAAVGALVLASAAQAVTVDFDTKDASLGIGAGPYGTVTWVQSGGSVNFTVALRSDLNFVNTGNKAVFTFNALNVAAGDVSNVKFAGSPNALFTVTAPASQTGSASFTLGIDCTASGCQNGAPGQTSDPLTFTVANALESDFGFGTVASGQYWFGADVICGASTVCGAGGQTGPVFVSGRTSVPEPATLGLLGLGLAGVGFARRRKLAA